MYTYEYESLEIVTEGWGPLAGAAYVIDGDHRQVIDARSRAGWRYVGYLPTRQRGTGHVQQIDLIFEKEV